MSLLSRIVRSSSPVDHHQEAKKKYRDAKNRLSTFSKYNWPSSSPVEVTSLAEAGFLLKKSRLRNDQVECVFCGINLADWKTGDDPFEEHRRVNPRCDFLMGYNVNNIPLDGKTTSDPVRGNNPRVDRGEDVFGHPLLWNSQPLLEDELSSHESVFTSSQESTSSSSSHSSSPTTSYLRSSLGNDVIQKHRPPCHANYVTFDSRLRSFPPNWNSICQVSASSLAEAGYFYAGPFDDITSTIMDAVTCFHCNQRTCHWEKEDNAWEEHRKQSPNCYFLRLNYCQDEKQKHGSQDTLSGIGKQLSTIAEMAHKIQEARCKVCLNHEIEMLFLPCRHANSCGSCASALTKCPTCRTTIDSSIRIYLS
jgi:hypothetical protein